jgi:hypothetical protein
MPPSANEGLADQVFTLAKRRRRERVRELNIVVVRVHEGAHSRRECAAVKRGDEIMSQGPIQLRGSRTGTP